MISVYDSIDKCCGCGACAQICAHKAITMMDDEYGFRYPVIEQSLCVDCELCQKVCNYQPVDKKSPIVTFVAQRKSKEIFKSASGGVFAELATKVIEQGGVVYGCIFVRQNGVLRPIIAEATTIADVEPMLGSKYVQSDTYDSYKKVKNRLKKGQMVLYSRVPCQVAGLKGFLRKDYDNLLTLDIICHGTPNERFFQSYISDLESKIRGTITKFNFRGKIKGWGDFAYTYTYTDIKGNEYNAWGCLEDSVYYKMFLASSIYRESCYHCPFASIHRSSDITIGDCWGIDVEHPEYDTKQGGVFDFKKGISCVLVNTEQGSNFIETNDSGLVLSRISLDSVVRYNHQLSRPSYDSPYRKEYYQAFLQGKYSGLKKKYYQLEWKQILKSKIYKMILDGLIHLIHIVKK